MKLIKKADSTLHTYSDHFQAREYSIDDKDINTALVTLSQRNPEKGYFMNEVCKEVVIVLSGEGSIAFKNSDMVSLAEGDSVVIEPGEMYFWEGKLELVVSCSPAWYPEQHKIIGEN